MQEESGERGEDYGQGDQGVILTVEVDAIVKPEPVSAGVRGVRKLKKKKRGRRSRILYGTFDSATKDGARKKGRNGGLREEGQDERDGIEVVVVSVQEA